MSAKISRKYSGGVLRGSILTNLFLSAGVSRPAHFSLERSGDDPAVLDGQLGRWRARIRGEIKTVQTEACWALLSDRSGRGTKGSRPGLECKREPEARSGRAALRRGVKVSPRCSWPGTDAGVWGQRASQLISNYWAWRGCWWGTRYAAVMSVVS